MTAPKVTKKLAAFSLIELTVSMAIIGIVMAMLSNVLVNSVIVSQKSIARSFIREEVTDIADRISNDLRDASRVMECDGKLGTAKCVMQLDQQIIWTTCTSSAGKLEICKTDSAGNILFASSPTFKLQDFTFEPGFDIGGNSVKKNIVVTILGDHANDAFNVKNILRQVSVSTRNYYLQSTGDSSNITPTPVCGNIKVETGEECDDGNKVNTDSCDNTCKLKPVCGNGMVQTGEQCDDANTALGDGCNNLCHKECNYLIAGGELCEYGDCYARYGAAQIYADIGQDMYYLGAIYNNSTLLNSSNLKPKTDVFVAYTLSNYSGYIEAVRAFIDQGENVVIISDGGTYSTTANAITSVYGVWVAGDFNNLGWEYIQPAPQIVTPLRGIPSAIFTTNGSVGMTTLSNTVKSFTCQYTVNGVCFWGEMVMKRGNKVQIIADAGITGFNFAPDQATRNTVASWAITRVIPYMCQPVADPSPVTVPPALINGIDTGINVVSGENVTITPTGSWCYQSGQCTTFTGTGANDSLKFDSKSKVTSKGVTALIARIGTGSWFSIPYGTSFTASGTGTLQLAMNDASDSFADNTGSVTAAIRIK